jgi:Uma2 family endonuclease
MNCGSGENVINLGMAIPAVKYTSPQEYLESERASKEKHEYFVGKVLAMAGASLAHNRLVANILRETGALLKGGPCEILPSDIRVSIPSRESYMYPDAVIVCGKPEMEDDWFDTLKNPLVIFEILSPSTEDHDRGKKFFFYRQIPSFSEFILIDSTRRFVELSRKQDDGSWIFGVVADPGGYVPITAIQGRISMDEIYRNVQFAPAAGD